MSEFSERLKTLIKRNGLTQSEFADECGITREAVCHYLSGRRSPCLTSIGKMCDCLEVSADYLIRGKEEGSFGEMRRLAVAVSRSLTTHQKLEIIRIIAK